MRLVALKAKKMWSFIESLQAILERNQKVNQRPGRNFPEGTGVIHTVGLEPFLSNPLTAKKGVGLKFGFLPLGLGWPGLVWVKTRYFILFGG